MMAQKAYQEVCKGLSFTELVATDLGPTEAVAYYGLLHDITILERVSGQEGAEVTSLRTALFETGGPVLIAPPKAPATIGTSVAVFWNATVQSARAIRSAMPILRKAQKVFVLSSMDNAHARETPIADHLAFYGIKAEILTFGSADLTARGRGRAMLSAVATTGADLAVLGAFGVNRIESMLGLGRATEKVVTSASIPLFIQA
jgi:nucleotide-binding universal stress UspA family protein